LVAFVKPEAILNAGAPGTDASLGTVWDINVCYLRN